MRRSPRRKDTGGVSLFPFLAVLICTMGSLIVLLVLVVKQAELQAQEQHHSDTRQSQEVEKELRIALEDQEFFRTTLVAQRPEMTDQLVEHRLQLSHLEEHIRKLKQQADLLAQQLEDLEQLDQLRQQDQSALREELVRAREQLDVARRQLSEAKERAANQPRSYALIPYQGPNGTNRRPIYVECTSQAVILQPEGIALAPGDFRDPLLPGNPLDAILLAVREHWARNGLLANGDEPYPLLIVRPGGAEAYSKARASMKSWEDEFGYELIDSKLKLKYSAADPVLAEILRKVVDDARMRHAALAAAQPSRFQGGSGDEGKTVLRASPSGGFVRERVPSGESSLPQSSGVPRGLPRKHNRQTNPDSFQSDFNQGRQANENSEVPPGENRADLTSQRGDGWGLPSKAPGAIGFTRPIRVLCYSDRLVVVPTDGSEQRPLITGLGPSTRNAIDQFVSTVWIHVDGWETAGRNAYWKPILNVKVAPGAESRFEDLQWLLRGSGLQVIRKN